MKRNIIASSCLISLTLIGCQPTSTGQPQKETPAPSVSAAAADNQVHTLKLPEFDPALPAGTGRETVQVQCGVCHTPHYILNQPPLSRETWIAEVTKMQKVFSAPIPADKVTEIVDYLLAVRGPVKQ